MKLKLNCPHCEKTLNIPSKYSGQRVKCPSCEQPLQIPELPTAVPAVVSISSDPEPPQTRQDPPGKQKMSYFLKRRGMSQAVQNAYGRLDRQSQKAFERDFKRRSKSTLTGYIFWVFLGWHYLYLGKVGLQFAFWFTFGGVLVWWLVDFVRMPGLISRFNEDLARQLMTEQSSLSRL